jgi:uncharacterized membrane protein
MLLDSLESITQLIRVSLPFAPRNAAFAPALRRLAFLGLTGAITLDLGLHTPAFNGTLTPKVRDDARRVLSTLFCVNHIRIRPSRAVDVLPMLPWLAMFQAVRRIELIGKTSYLKTSESLKPSDAAAAYCAEAEKRAWNLEVQAKAALPWVGDVRVSGLWPE